MIKYFYLILLFISYPCFSDENKSDNKILIENRMILGSALKIVIPSVESCVTKNSCHSTGLYNIKITENNNTATIELTNTKGDGTYTLIIKKENKGLVLKSEKMVMRDYLDDENYKLCFKYDNNGSVIDALDYSSGELISGSGMTCVKCSLNQTSQECEKNLIKTENPKVANDIKHYENSHEGIRSQLITYHETMYIISVSEKSSTCLIKARVENDKAYFQPVKLIVEGDVDSNGSITIKYLDEKIVISNFSPPNYCGLFTDITGSYKLNSSNDFLLTEYFSNDSLDELVFTIKNKTYLYKNNYQKTKMYLIKGDKITLLAEKTDDLGQKWHYINYKGKKDLNMWIKAEAIDIEPEKETPQKPESSKTKEPELAPQTKIQTPIEVAKQKLVTIPPKNAEIIKAEKAEPIEKSASGSISLVLLVSTLGLLGWKFKNIM